MLRSIDQALHSRAAKPVVWLLALLPVMWLLWALFSDGLGANPAEALIRSTGDWALRGLCVALAVTPLSHCLQTDALKILRRLIGLFAFFYVALHALSYAWLDMAWSGAALLDDVVQRPFIGVGALAALLLLLLALTSTYAAVQAMGVQRWKRLHQCVHLAAWMALLHFYWMRAAKNDVQEVALYVAVIALLQTWRVWQRRVRS